MSQESKAPITGTIEESVQSPSSQQEVQAPKPNTELDDRFATLARREKAIRTEAQRIAQEKAAWEAQRSQAPAPDAWKGRAKTDLMGMLAEAGVSYEEASQAFLNTTPESATIQRLQAQIAELKGEVTSKLGKFDEHTKQSYDRALNQYKRDIDIAISSRQDDFEMIHTAKAQEAVLELIKETFDKEQILLTVEEACKQVEDHLLEEAVAYSKSKKVQSKLAPPPPVEQQEPKTQPTQQTQTKTLTNAITASSKPMSDKDRRARAIAAFMANKQ
jgi:hypothetical protein